MIMLVLIILDHLLFNFLVSLILHDGWNDDTETRVCSLAGEAFCKEKNYCPGYRPQETDGHTHYS